MRNSNRPRLAILLPFVLIFIIAAPAIAVVDSETAIKLGQHMLKKFESQGSFKASYLGTKNGAAPFRLNLFYAARSRYVALEQFSDAGSSEPDLVFLIDFHDSPVYTLVSSEGKGFQFSFNDQLESMNHPLGIFLAALRRVGDANDRNILKINAALRAPVIDIQLKEESVSGEVEISSSGPVLRWLDKDRLLQAQNISWTESMVTIAYSPVHTVKLDLRTGLLLEDKWIQADKTERKLVLDKFEKTEKEMKPADYLARYKNLSRSKDLTGEFLDKQYISFLIAVAEAMNKEKDLDAFLLKNSDGLRKAAREFAEAYGLQLRIAEIQGDKKQGESMKKYTETFLIPAHQYFIKNSGKDMSFQDFLHLCRKDDGFKDLFVSEEDVQDRLDLGSDKYIDALPQEYKKPLLLLVKIVKKDVYRGLQYAYIDSLLYYAENFYKAPK